MDSHDFRDAALVVLGHGTDQNAGSSAPVYQHAAALRRRDLFAEVREAFWKQEPHVGKVLAAISAPRVFVAPLFVGGGYFAGEVIPRTLGFGASHLRRQAAQTWVYCDPVGTHDRMTHVILARARQVVAHFPFPQAPHPKDITLLIAGHGTEKNENSRVAVERQAALIRAQGLYAGVETIYLEESPPIAAAYGLARTRNLVVVPLFISDGLHTQEDIPVQLGEAKRSVAQRLAAGQPAWRNPTEKNGKLVWYAPAVGTEPGLAEVMLERVQEAAARASRLRPPPEAEQRLGVGRQAWEL